MFLESYGTNVKSLQNKFTLVAVFNAHCPFSLKAFMRRNNNTNGTMRHLVIACAILPQTAHLISVVK